MGELHFSGVVGLPHFKSTSTQTTPLSLVYGAEAIVTIQIMVPSSHLILTSKVSDSRDRIHDIESLRKKE